jgi:hypothetical protein
MKIYFQYEPNQYLMASNQATKQQQIIKRFRRTKRKLLTFFFSYVTLFVEEVSSHTADEAFANNTSYYGVRLLE